MIAKHIINAALCVCFVVGFAFAQRNVAVLEIERHPDVMNEISRGEAMEITGVIRSEAVNNLPSSRYSVMTSETVMSMGGAVAADCADENCVITIGRRIDADYIVLGTIRKFQTRFTLNVEMFETEYGNLVATAVPVRSANLEEILEKSAGACAAMYRKFLETAAQAGPSAAIAMVTPAPSVSEPVAETPSAPKPERPPRPERSPKPERAPRPERPPKPERSPKPERAPRNTGAEVSSGWYAAAGYQPPVSEWQILNVEGGGRFKNGMFLGAGLDYNIPVDGLSSTGVSLNYGMTYDLPLQFPLTLAYGVSGNCRFLQEDFRLYAGGAFVKLRYKFVELSYRGLMGSVVSPSFEETDEFGVPTGVKITNSEIVYINQLMLGVYFAF